LMGVWGRRPQRGPGAEPLAFLGYAGYLPISPESGGAKIWPGGGGAVIAYISVD